MTERAQILEMLASGKITPEQGVELLSTLPSAARESDRPAAGGPQPVSAAAAPAAAGGKSPHWFHVRVSDSSSGRTKVNISLPLGLVKLGLQIGARFAPEVAELNPDELVGALREASSGPLVDVQDDEDGERVEIFVD